MSVIGTSIYANTGLCDIIISTNTDPHQYNGYNRLSLYTLGYHKLSIHSRIDASIVDEIVSTHNAIDGTGVIVSKISISEYIIIIVYVCMSTPTSQYVDDVVDDVWLDEYDGMIMIGTRTPSSLRAVEDSMIIPQLGKYTIIEDYMTLHQNIDRVDDLYVVSYRGSDVFRCTMHHGSHARFMVKDENRH